MTDSGSHPNDEARWKRLTDKQRACLDLVLELQTSKQIARRLDISKQAVDLRLTNARDILGGANRDETAIIYARLRQTYDRMPWHPVILPDDATLLPSEEPDGEDPEPLMLHDGASQSGLSTGNRPPPKGLLRPDHRASHRVAIYLGTMLLLVVIALGGLGIAQALNQLLAN